MAELLIKQRFAILVVFILLTIQAGFYVQTHLQIDTDTKDLLSAELRWRQLDMLHDRLFPQYNENILMVIEAPSADEAEDAARALYQTLMADSKSPFPELYYPEALPFFRHSGLLFQDLETLDTQFAQIIDAQAALGSLAEDLSLRGLAKLISQALDAESQGYIAPPRTLLRALSASLDGFHRGEKSPLSWAALMRGEDNTATLHRRLIITRIDPDFSSLIPASTAIAYLREQAQRIDLEGNFRAQLRLGGQSILAHEELQSIARTNKLAIALSLSLVTLLLCMSLGRWAAVAAVLTLIVGLILTTAFAIWTLGALNLISIAFAVLYIGLGIDFAIHYALRWQASGGDNGRPLPDQTSCRAIDPVHCIRHTHSAMARPLLLCALTTAAGFFAFVPTDYQGVAELGWIAGCGMFISLLLSLSLLPVLLSLARDRSGRPRHTPPMALVTAVWYRIVHRPWWVLIPATCLCIVAVSQSGTLRFDIDTLNLQDPSNESVQVYETLLSEPRGGPKTLLALHTDRDAARQLVAQFRKLPQVDEVTWLESFIPDGQERKLALIDDMNLLLGDFTTKQFLHPVSDAEDWVALQTLQKRLDARNDSDADWHLLRENLRRSMQRVTTGADTISALREQLLGGLPGRLAELDDALRAQAITEDMLPKSLQARWYSNGHYQIRIHPKAQWNDPDALSDFVIAVSAIHPDITGPALLQYEAGKTVRSAFREALFYALCAITLLLACLLRSLRDSLAVSLTLILGACLCAGCMLMFGMSFNFANIIALPLLLGIGVDSGIHMLHCYREQRHGTARYPFGTQGRGVVISAMTTIFSIACLAFSPHRGMANLGLLLSTGIAIMALCMLCVLPALLAAMDQIHHKILQHRKAVRYDDATK